MSVVLKEGKSLRDLLLFEMDRNYCREDVIILAGNSLKFGTILDVDADGKYLQSKADGNGVAVLLENCDAASKDTRAVVCARISIVDGTCLIYPAGVKKT